MIRLAAVDDDRMLLDGLEHWLAEATDLNLVAVAGTVDDLLRGGECADVVLLDLVLRDGSGAAGNVARLVAAGYRVLVIGVWSDPPGIAAILAAGAHGYLTKDHDLPELAAAVRVIASGGTAFSPELAQACLADTRPGRPRLSPREQEILQAYASGMTLRAAARYVGVAPETAKTYLERVKTKYAELGRPTYTKLDLANRAREDGLS